MTADPSRFYDRAFLCERSGIATVKSRVGPAIDMGNFDSLNRSGASRKRHLLVASCAFGTQIQESGIPYFQAKFFDLSKTGLQRLLLR